MRGRISPVSGLPIDPKSGEISVQMWRKAKERITEEDIAAEGKTNVDDKCSHKTF